MQAAAAGRYELLANGDCPTPTRRRGGEEEAAEAAALLREEGGISSAGAAGTDRVVLLPPVSGRFWTGDRAGLPFEGRLTSCRHRGAQRKAGSASQWRLRRACWKLLLLRHHPGRLFVAGRGAHDPVGPGGSTESRQSRIVGAICANSMSGGRRPPWRGQQSPSQVWGETCLPRNCSSELRRAAAAGLMASMDP